MVGGIAVSFVCGLAAVGVVWLLTRDLYGVAVANMAAFIFAVLPIPRALAADAQSDMPHALLYLTAAWLACARLELGPHRAVRRRRVGRRCCLSDPARGA